MSDAAAPRPDDAGEIVRRTARAFERDRYLAALLASRDRRDDLVALAAFAGEVARIPGFVTEPAIGEIRLQWWRDTLEAGLVTGLAAGHPIADAVCGAARRHGTGLEALHALIDAQAERLDDVPFADLPILLAHLARWDGGLFRVAWRFAGGGSDGDDDVAALLSTAGEVYGLARVLIELPAELAQGRSLLPRDLLKQQGLSVAALGTPHAAAGVTAISAILAREARERLGRIIQSYQAAPRAARMAALPVALVRPYLRVSHDFGQAGLGASDIGPLTRVWRLWITSLTGRL